MTLCFLLAGAYYPQSRLLQPVPLDVEICLSLGTLARAPLRMDLAGTVRIEGIAEGAEAAGELRVAPSAICYRLDFRADDGARLELVFSQSLGRITVRSLTELSGHVRWKDGGGTLGTARLRFDARRAVGL